MVDSGSQSAIYCRIVTISFYFRPDLLDWRQVERRDVRERIDLAFHIMDREYGVTRLLDPEGKCLFLDLSTDHSVSNYSW